MIGSSLAHYKILKKIGSGGMGEVYLAEDTKLGRRVAIKVLPPEMVTAERLDRFQREAKAIATLSRPNIVTVFSVEQADEIHFITMEFVEGKTLSELIPKRGMKPSQVLELAIPLADAVSAAHDRGVVHRDLKPDNVMVTVDFWVKVLDFGLALWNEPLVQDGASELPTRSQTTVGRIVGTVHYMSPEQAEGRSVDHRSDIFSLGVMLFEMMTGTRPFQGDTPTSVLSSILKDTPPAVAELNPEAPRELSKLIRRCLAKAADDRLQSAKDLRNQLRELKRDWESGELDATETLPKRPRRLNTSWLGLAAVAMVGIVFGVRMWSEGPAPGALPRLTNPRSSHVGCRRGRLPSMVSGREHAYVPFESAWQLGHMDHASRDEGVSQPHGGPRGTRHVPELVARWQRGRLFLRSRGWGIFHHVGPCGSAAEDCGRRRCHAPSQSTVVVFGW
jgi:serine/threonine protein kinase